MKPELTTDFTARLDVTRADAERSYGEPTDAELELINQHSPVPRRREEIFVFEGIISTDALDSYFTKMDPLTTLQNFAAELREGRPLQPSHNIKVFSIGQSFASETMQIFDAEGKPATLGVLGRYYLQRGITLDGQNIDDVIEAIKGGTLRRMSIGLGFDANTKLTCSICGNDMLDWFACGHFPGIDYDGNVATGLWVNGHLREVSVVYMNATPGALIRKAERMVENGRIARGLADRVNRMYGGTNDIGEGRAVKSFADLRKPPTGGNRLNEFDAKELLKQLRARMAGNLSTEITSRITEIGSAEGISESDVAQIVADAVADAERRGEGRVEDRVKAAFSTEDASEETLREQRSNAIAGVQYRKDLAARARQAKVAALDGTETGSKFDADKYEKRLGNFDIDELREEVEVWEQARAQRFSEGRKVPAGNPGEDSDGGKSEQHLEL